MKKYKYVFFDLDGTLTDPFEGITRSVRRALAHFGSEVADLNDLRCFIGPPLRDSFVRFYSIPQDRLEEAVGQYREYFAVKGLFENELYGGVRDMLSELHSNGVRIILATSKPEIYARRITEYFGIDKYFYRQCGATLDGRIDTKAQVIAYALLECEADASEVLMIGDRSHDILGARQCGVDSVGVLWGYGNRDELESAGAMQVYSSVDEITEALREYCL